MSQTEKELSYKAFLNREYGFSHSPFEKEFEFYDTQYFSRSKGEAHIPDRGHPQIGDVHMLVS